MQKELSNIIKWTRDLVVRRRLAQLGGTSTWGDCLVALRYLLPFTNLLEGKSIKQYEKAFAERIGVRYAYSFSAGRVGFYGLLRALGIGTGDEVLLQVPTHIVVPNAIRYTGAKPIYVDCNLDNFNMDLAQARKKITSRSKAIILQHTFGIPVDMDDALDLAERSGLSIIEDCVHSLGAKYDEKPLGSFGRAAFFSTEETKTISSTMGGVTVTNDPEIAEKLLEFRAVCSLQSPWLVYRYVLKLVLYHIVMQPNFHRLTRTIYELLGNYHPLPRPTSEDELVGKKPKNYEQRLSNVQAALALQQLKRLDGNLHHRAKIADLYKDYLSELGFKLPQIPPKAEAAYVRYPLLIQDRKVALKKFAPYLVLGTWFTSVLEEAISPIWGEYCAGSCPRAEIAAKHLINLPTHPRVNEHDVKKFVGILKTLQ